MSEVENQAVDPKEGSDHRSFTQPFGFADRLSKTKGTLDFVPLIDLIVVALFVGLMFTRFVVQPGVRVDLPATDMRMQHPGSSVAVLTIGANQMLFFDGAVYDAATIGRALVDFVGQSDGRELALLIKLQSSMDVQSFLELCESAQVAGFDQVQIVGQKKEVDGTDAVGSSTFK